MNSFKLNEYFFKCIFFSKICKNSIHDFFFTMCKAFGKALYRNICRQFMDYNLEVQIQEKHSQRKKEMEEYFVLFTPFILHSLVHNVPLSRGG